MTLRLIAIAIAAFYGAKKAYDGYEKTSQADEIVKTAQAIYDKSRSSYELQEKKTQQSLENLGKKQLQVGEDLQKFRKIVDQWLSRLNRDQSQFRFDLKDIVPSSQMEKIQAYEITSTAVLGALAGGSLAGAAAGFAAYGGVMTLASASTGTAIASLSGAAATKATLAALGGGALKAGGLGILGGKIVLLGAVAAPVLAIAGWVYDSHGDDALKHAEKAQKEVQQAVDKLGKTIQHLERVSDYAQQLYQSLNTMHEKFLDYSQYLHILNVELEHSANRKEYEENIDKLSDLVRTEIQNGYLLAGNMVDLISTPIFKIKTINGQVQKDDDGAPLPERDADGLLRIDEEGIEQALQKAQSKFKENKS